ncbi:Platinum sensitivity protein [Mortierella sp. 14UC]|nr:Platinum sensitivity protein [Mortierella sp. 14UC]
MPVHSTQNDRASALTEKPAEEHVQVQAISQSNGDNTLKQANSSDNSTPSTVNKAIYATFSSTDDDDSDEEKDLVLPSPTTRNLNDILVLMGTAMKDKHDLEDMQRYIVEKEYIAKFIPLFKICGRLQLTKQLFALRYIFLTIILNGTSAVIEEALKDEAFMTVLGILEQKQKAPQYRLMYSPLNNLEEIIPFEDQDTKKLINQVCRLQFLKDKVLHNHMKSTRAGSTFEMMIKSKTVEFVQDISYDKAYMGALFAVLADESESMHRREHVVFFVYQLCIMAKKANVNIYRKIAHIGLSDLLEFAFKSTDNRVKQAGVDILFLALEKNPRSIHLSIVDHPKAGKDTKGFFTVMMNEIRKGTDTNYMPRFAEAIHILMDIDPMQPNEDDSASTKEEASSHRKEPTEKRSHHRNESTKKGSHHRNEPTEKGSHQRKELAEKSKEAEWFLLFFYKEHCRALVRPLLKLKQGATSFDPLTTARFEIICQLLIYLVRRQPAHIKNVLSSSRLVEKLCLLLHSDAMPLRLKALKFFTACLEQEDDYFHQILIDNQVTHEVLRALKQTKVSRNVIYSACLNFFDCMQKNNIQLLVFHCVKAHKKVIESYNCIPVFKELMALHAGNNDGGAERQAFRTMIAARLREIPYDTLRPIFKRETIDKKMNTDEARIAKRKREDVDGTGEVEETARMRPKQKCNKEDDTSNINTNN